MTQDAPKQINNEWYPTFSDLDNRFERNILNQHRRHARKLDLPATLTMQQWYDTLLYFRWKCAYCQNKPYGVLEHFISLAKGGGTTSYNCVPACQSCNVKKSQHSMSLQNEERVRRYLMTQRDEVQV